MAEEKTGSLKVSGGLHKRLRIMAAERGVRIQPLVEHLLERAMKLEARKA